ncbi:MAG: HAMP domain-containing histidine kinase [Oscillospiraceae bacterium]|nr:HAMP domain-containing histidine kinase [Oscillospiraceae bacterium]
MIRKLRARFTAAAMLSLFIVLAVLMGAVNLYNYHRIAREADETLSVLSENSGRFPLWMTAGRPVGPGEGRDTGSDWYASPEEEPPEKPWSRRQGASVELPFESRFFSLVTDEDGEICEWDLDNIAAVDETEAASLAKRVLSSGKAVGYIGQYRYAVMEQDGGARVTFLDCSRSLSNFRTFLLASVIVSAAGLGAVLLLMLWLSGRITRPIAESYEKQKRFITDAGHEIKTPITIIDADAEVLSMDLPDSEWIDDIRLQTKRLTSLTNDLIFLSRMDEENMKVRRMDFPISDMVNEAVQSFRSRALRENKDLRTEIEPMLTFCGEEKSLRQLVNVLTDNAVKYSPEGGEITVELKRTGKGLALSVTNTCENVPEGDLNDLFDRFYRAEKSRNSQTGGHGLGLSIARAVVAAHKGKITASSPAEHTMRFDVLLPIKGDPPGR